MVKIKNLLEPFQRFGVHLGLERIEKLLHNLGDPHLVVPIIHVTGTNGKGSVCAYLSAVLTTAGYRVGRYTSPHLVDWTERICLNEAAISTERLSELLTEIQTCIEDQENPPTQFEVLTAAAWLYFAREKVDIGVIEVGLGGRLDATNVCDRPLVSVITSISREHWQHLGSTLAEIAWEKAGILKHGCPAVLGKLPPEAETVVTSRLDDLNCPRVWVEPAQRTTAGAIYQDVSYPLSLAGDIQLLNSAIAIATLKILQQQNWRITQEHIQQGMGKTRWLGRIQWVNWRDRTFLLDGAHNRAAAVALRQYVDTLNRPITWVMGILATKDHAQIFEALLRSGDELYLVPVPDHSTANTQTLAEMARQICPHLQDCRTFPELFMALSQALNQQERLIVVCGSLYLVGYFLANYPLRR
ncbi:folylpolyglutamate synthase/dihydrofolate synthase family protein [Gloeocapsa sp. PCC 73106]|uniref:bifunctional folylpolyglutamate synthase/dihydrofolate synthase n=1 Tax=Gloeocapsa sp. PCC 73106 TaxID=102232 RepID=UPI0002DAD18A|nr:folylpolyglutamate synthase/dihydrofolate synthase family protein [Gloeocapsa sp. PCC 73106]